MTRRTQVNLKGGRGSWGFHCTVCMPLDGLCAPGHSGKGLVEEWARLMYKHSKQVMTKTHHSPSYRNPLWVMPTRGTISHQCLPHFLCITRRSYHFPLTKWCLWLGGASSHWLRQSRRAHGCFGQIVGILPSSKERERERERERTEHAKLHSEKTVFIQLSMTIIAAN